MSKQELAISNFAQRISAAYLTLDIGGKLSVGKSTSELILKLKQLRQLNKLFDYEYGKVDSNIEVLQKINLVTTTLLNNYRLDGTYTIEEADILPVQAQFANFIIVQEIGGSTIIIDDTETSLTTVWSSDKVAKEIIEAIEAIPEPDQIKDNSTSTTETWSSSKIHSEDLVLQSNISNSMLRSTTKAAGVTGSLTIDIAELIGKSVTKVFRSSTSDYIIGDVASSGEVIFNPINGRITFDVPFSDNEFVSALYSNTDGAVISLGNSSYQGNTTPNGDPGLVTGNSFWSVTLPGTYINFGGVELPTGYFGFISYDKSVDTFNIAVGVVNTVSTDHFKGYFNSLSALESVYPTAALGDYGYVDNGVGDPVQSYIWDINDNIWILSSGETVTFLTIAGSPFDNSLLASILDSKAELPNELVTGGGTTVVGNDITVSPATWRIAGINRSKLTPTAFTGIPNSGLGDQRFVAFYGNSSNNIVKIEGLESNLAVMPVIPDGTALISFVLVGDSGIGAPEIDLSGYALKTDLGDKTLLRTVDKSSIVNGLNEITNEVGSLTSDQITLKIFKVSNYATP